MANTIVSNDMLMNVKVEARCEVDFVPLRQIVHSVGGDFRWNNDTKTAVATVGPQCAVFSLASAHADVSGRDIAFTAPSFIEYGEVYVPIDFIPAAFGYRVQVDDGSVLVTPPA